MAWIIICVLTIKDAPQLAVTIKALRYAPKVTMPKTAVAVFFVVVFMVALFWFVCFLTIPRAV